jgi:hypothetical protein
VDVVELIFGRAGGITVEHRQVGEIARLEVNQPAGLTRLGGSL